MAARAVAATALLVLEGMRPLQWVKNAFVLAPLVFAKRLLVLPDLTLALLAVAAYCLASSAVYLLNDVVDAPEDRRHPGKRHRPVASGRLSASLALWSSALLALLALLGALLISLPLAACLLGFLALNAFYIFVGKRVAYLDVLAISGSFILRVVGGALAIPVELSGWILLCTFFISLYLGLGKRLHELLGTDGSTRRSLAGYSPLLTRGALVACGLAALAAFACYSVSARALANFGTSNLLWTTPLVALGQLRFFALASRTGSDRSPTDAMIRDPLFLLAGLAWGLAVLVLVYMAGQTGLESRP